MRNKIVWSIISLSMVAALLLASCGPKAAPTPTPGAVTPTPAPAPITPAPGMPAPTPTPAPTPDQMEKPKYGGTINLLQASDLARIVQYPYFPTNMLTSEHLIEQDWEKGPGGTNQISMDSFFVDLKFNRGHIAESWEIVSSDTWKFKIRQGIHWALDPNNEASRLVNGRELTVDDVVFSAKRYLELNLSIRPLMAKAATVEKTGPREITIKAPVDPWWAAIAFVYGFAFRLQAPEVVQKYDVYDWRNTVGEGPFMLTDFVPSSAMTLTRNPNYWYKNHTGPGKGDQLPYVDTVKLLIVIDPSTQMAALRTARLDWVNNIPSEDTRGLLRTAPNLKYVKTSKVEGRGIWMRTDKSELPFKDRRVRQALMMATDFESMKNDLYGGDAFYPIGPVAPSKETEGIYIPVDELPESARTLFKYNPARAKQLLAEAGYPNGFKTTIIVSNASIFIDPVSAVKSMWAKVGVDLEILPRETAVFTTIFNRRAHEEMILYVVRGGLYAIPALQGFRGPASNHSYLDDPKIEAAAEEMAKYIIIDMPKVFQIGKEMIPYLHEQAYYIGLPQPYTYRLWQPWVKNYHGETTLSWGGANWVKYVWIDQDLKEKMTGRR